MPTDQNNPEHFPELNEIHLRSFAQQIVKRFSDVPISEISLYNYANIYFRDKDISTKYIVIFKRADKADDTAKAIISSHQDFYQTDFSYAEIWEILSVSLDPFSKALGELTTLRDPSTFNELTGGRPFSMFYRNGVAPEKYFTEWRFKAIHEDQNLPRCVLLDDPHWVLFEGEELFLANLLRKVSPEIEPLYDAVKNVGFSAHKHDATEETWRKAALEYFDSHKDSFNLVKREYLETKDLYFFASGQARRDFIGRVLQDVVEEKGLGSRGKEDLVKEYNRITSN